MSDPMVRLDVAYRPTSRLTVVPVADEAAVYDRRKNKLHRLDPIATAVWSRLDGTTSTADLAASLARDFGAPAGRVSHDVVALLETLMGEGLVVSSDAPEDDDADEDTGDADEEPALGPAEVRVLGVTATPCVDAVTALGWHATDPLVVAGYGLGVRTSDEETRHAVREAMPGYWPETTLPVDANLSIQAPRETDAGLELGRVYADCTLVGRGRTIDELLDRVRREVAGRVLRGRGDPLACEVTVLDGPGGLLLAPYTWWSTLLAYDTRLRASGWTMRGRHALLGTAARSGALGLPTLGSRGEITYEWLGRVCMVTAALDEPNPVQSFPCDSVGCHRGSDATIAQEPPIRRARRMRRPIGRCGTHSRARPGEPAGPPGSLTSRHGEGAREISRALFAR